MVVEGTWSWSWPCSAPVPVAADPCSIAIGGIGWIANAETGRFLGKRVQE